MNIRLPLFIPLIVVACGAPLKRDEPDLPVEVPEEFGAAQQEEEASEDAWWTTFEQPELDSVIREALAGNYTLRALAQRLQAASALARIAGADRLPTVGAGASAARDRLVFPGIPSPDGSALTNTVSTYGVSLDVAWEVDLWGRLSARAKAAEADQAAVGYDYEAARQSLAAQVAKVWFALQEALLQQELARTTVDSFSRTNDVVLRRFRSGRGSAFDVRSSEAELAGARALLERRGEQVERVERQLEILLGRYPSGDVEGPGDLPAVGEAPGAGVPSELLLRRPDLRAAELQLLAADYALYEARASLYPQLTLTGSIGRVGTETENLTDSGFDVWSIAAGLVQPIYQGGRLRANVDLAQAGVREALAIYADSVLAAFSEVEINLAVNDYLANEESFERGSVTNAEDAYALAQSRYAAGLEDIAALRARGRVAPARHPPPPARGPRRPVPRARGRLRRPRRGDRAGRHPARRWRGR